MVLDLFRDPTLTDRNENNLYEKRWEFFWNLGEYHSRWASLGKEDFAGERAIAEKSRVWKGAMPLSGVVERKEHKYKKRGAGGVPVYDEQSKEYLEKIIDLCDDRGIRLILVNTGFDCSDEAKLFHDSVVDIAANNRVPYYDFTKEDFIDFGTDLNSTGHNTHVNFSGAEKMSERLVENLGERVEAWTADEWDEVDWGSEALDSEPEDTADLIIAVYSKHDGKVVDVRSFKN